MIRKILKRIFSGNRFVPGYAEKREIILSYKKNYNPSFFIETGTFMGDTVFSLIDEFTFLYSIELSAELAAKAKARFAPYKHVEIISGSSDIELTGILNKLEEPTLIWLDGHYSGEFIHNDELVKTAKGTLNTPVVRELELILDSAFAHIILIDDARLFNGTNDYPTIRTLKKLLKTSKIKRELTVMRDVIRIVPAAA